MTKQEERLRQYEKLTGHRKKIEKEGRKEEIPTSCRKCKYYRPEFRYRVCLYARCPYDMHKNAFRQKPKPPGKGVI